MRMITANGINYQSAKSPGDLLLFSLKYNSARTKSESKFFDWDEGEKQLGLKTNTNIHDFYPEIYLEVTLDRDDLHSLMDEKILIICGETVDCNGWQLYIDKYGYLCFSGTGEASSLQVVSPLSLTSFVSKTFKIGISLNNPSFTIYPRKYWKDNIPYNRLLLLCSGSKAGKMEILAKSQGFACPLLSPVPERIKIPLAKKSGNGLSIRQIRGYNTGRHELFQPHNSRKLDGCSIKSNVPGAGRVFIDRTKDILDLYTGPEFCQTTSYWLFAKIEKAVQGKTKLRINLTISYGGEAMSPVFFWSRDRKHWFRLPPVKVMNEGGDYAPVVLAPEKDFYLASSIPFLEKELEDLTKNVEHVPIVKVIKIGSTVEGRPINLFRIAGPDVDLSEKKHLVIIVGQHSPLEMLGAHFLPCFIEHCKKDSGLLRKAVIHFVPLVNVDCAHWGGNGSNVNKANLNRHWFTELQPETIAIRKYLEDLKMGGMDIDLFLDIHGGGVWKNHVVLRHPRDYILKSFPDSGRDILNRMDRVLEFLENHAGFRLNDGLEHRHQEPNYSARDYVKTTFPKAIVFDIELSTSSYFDPVEKCSKPFDQNSLEVVGKGMVQALEKCVEWLV